MIPPRYLEISLTIVLVVFSGCLGGGPQTGDADAPDGVTFDTVADALQNSTDPGRSYWANVTIRRNGTRHHGELVRRTPRWNKRDSKELAKLRFTEGDHAGDILLLRNGTAHRFDASTGQVRTVDVDEMPRDPVMILRSMVANATFGMTIQHASNATVTITTDETGVENLTATLDRSDWLPRQASFQHRDAFVTYHEIVYDINVSTDRFALPQNHTIDASRETPESGGSLSAGGARGDTAGRAGFGGPPMEVVNRSLHRARGPSIQTRFSGSPDHAEYVASNDSVRFAAAIGMERGPDGEPREVVAQWESVPIEEYAEWQCASAALDALRPEYTQPGASMSGKGHLNETLAPERYHGVMVATISYSVVRNGSRLERPPITFQDYLARLPRTVHVSVTIDGHDGTCDVPVFVEKLRKRVVQDE